MFLIILQLFVSSFLLSTASVPTQVKVAVNEYYVTPTPAPNPECPHDKPCHTLNEYAQNSSSFFNNQTSIVLLFLNGRHNLTSCNLLISKLDSVNFTGGLSKPLVIVQNSWKISFVNAAVVHIQNLIIISNRTDRAYAFEIIDAREFNCYQVAFHLGQWSSMIYLRNVHSIIFSRSHYAGGSVNYNHQKGPWYNQNHNEKQLRLVNFTLTNCTFSNSDIEISLDAEQTILNVTLHNCTISPGVNKYWGLDSGIYIKTNGNESIVVLDIAHSDISYNGNGAVTIHSLAKQSVIDICIKDSVFNSNDIEV